MVKAYLRYHGDKSIGVITSRECNVAFDRTGRLALTGCVEAVGVWNVRLGTRERALKTPQASERVTRLCVKGGKQAHCAVGYSDGTVRLWDYEQGAALQIFQGHKSGISCLAFDGSGHFLASGADDTDIVVWDVVSESGVARLRGHIDQVTAVLFWEAAKPAGGEGGAGGSGRGARLISASKDRFVRIWSVELQLCLQVLTEHKVEVWSLGINAAHTRLACGSADKFLRVWALSADASGKEDDSLATYLGAVPRPTGQGSAIGLQFVQPEGLGSEVLLCQGSGKALESFRCQGALEVRKRQRRRRRRAELKKQKRAEGHETTEEPVDEVATADAGEAEAEDAEEATAAGAEEEGGTTEGPRAADELVALAPHHFPTKVMSMAWCAATSSVLVGFSTNALQSIKVVPDEEKKATVVEDGFNIELPGHRTAVRSLAVAKDDSLLMSTSAEAVKIWNVATGNCIRTMASGYGLCGFFVAGNEHVVVGTKEGQIEFFDLRVGELSQRCEAHSGAVYGIAERPDNKGFATVSADKHLRLFEFTFMTGTQSSVSFDELRDQAVELPDECLDVVYTPNEKWIAVALLNHTVQLYFADTGKFYLALYGHRLPVMSLDASSDSQMIASGSSDKNIKLWNPQFGNCHRSLRGHDESVMQVRFMPGTHYLVSVGRDRQLKLWDCDSYELITSFQGHVAEILAIALSQDAAFIVTAGGDRQIRFWKRGQEQLFLSEERAKELDDKFEQEVEREDRDGGVTGAVALRPSRRTVESVKSTEMLMEILDAAAAEEKDGDTPAQITQTPCTRVISYVNTLTSNNIYEVLLALPFGHSVRLLEFISRFFQAVAALPDGGSGGSRQVKTLSAVATLETPCQAALIAAYVHHAELAMTPNARALLFRLRQQMRDLLQAEKDRIGLTTAGFSHLRRAMGRSGGGSAATVLAAVGGAGGAAAGKKGSRPGAGAQGPVPTKRRRQ